VPYAFPLQGAGSFDELARTASPELTALPTQAADDCFWLYSSGTTGRPKGVVHIHRSIAVTCQRFAIETLGAEESDVFFSVPRLYFSYGLGCAMTNPLWVGGTAILDDRRPTPQTVAEVFRRFKPSIFAGVPTFYAALLNAGGMTRADFNNLRRALSGGEATPIEIMRRWRELTGVPITEVIGSTETLHIYMGNRIDDIRVGTLGKPVSGYQVKLIDERGNVINDERPGRLWVKGQSLARCYWNNPEKTEQAFVDGWINTGDTMFRDANGYYVFCGRADDMMKISGRFVSHLKLKRRLSKTDACLKPLRSDARIVMVSPEFRHWSSSRMPRWPPRRLLTRSASYASAGSHTTNIQNGSRLSIICQRQRPGRFNATNCALNMRHYKL